MTALRYWLPSVDDVFDRDTARAVTAFQKVTGLRRDGVAGPQVQAALLAATPPAPRTTGDTVEIDLGRKVLLVVDDGRLRAVIDVSTGRTAGSTPVGRFSVEREIDGYRRSPLGVLYRPKYFHGGVAIHGYPTVPPYPASHGCVRTTNAAMDWLWSSGSLPVGMPVRVYP